MHPVSGVCISSGCRQAKSDIAQSAIWRWVNRAKAVGSIHLFETGKDYVTVPYDWEADGETVTGVSFGTPLRDGGRAIGVTGGESCLHRCRESTGSLDPTRHRLRSSPLQSRQLIAHADGALLGKNWANGRSPTDRAFAQERLAVLKEAREFSQIGYSNTLDTEVSRVFVRRCPAKFECNKPTNSLLIQI